MAWNRLTSWAEIAVLMEIPNLQVVNLSHNPLKNSIDAELPYANHLKTLIINGINLPFTTIGHFVSKMPSLYELHISDNRCVYMYFFAIEMCLFMKKNAYVPNTEFFEYFCRSLLNTIFYFNLVFSFALSIIAILHITCRSYQGSLKYHPSKNGLYCCIKLPLLFCHT